MTSARLGREIGPAFVWLALLAAGDCPGADAGTLRPAAGTANRSGARGPGPTAASGDKGAGFIDATTSTGVREAIARHYAQHANWWLSFRESNVAADILWNSRNFLWILRGTGTAGAKIRIADRSRPEQLLWFEQVTILDSQSAHS